MSLINDARCFGHGISDAGFAEPDLGQGVVDGGVIFTARGRPRGFKDIVGRF